MGWTAYYQILRDRPLDESEVITLHDFIRRTNRTPWDGEYFGLKVTREARLDHVLATGWQKFPLSDASDDQERLLEVLTKLSKLLEDVEIRVEDDFEVFGWDEDAGEAAMDGPTTDLVSIKDYDSFVMPDVLVGPRPEPLGEDVERLLAGAKPTRKAIAAALVEHANLTNEDPRRAQLAAVLHAAPARMLVQAGLDAFASLTGTTETLEILAAAPLNPEDVAAIAFDFMAAWKDPRGVHWYEVLARAFSDSTLDALARLPRVEKEMRADLSLARADGEDEMTYRCAQAAAEMLGRAVSRRGLLELLETGRVVRSRTRHRVMPSIVAALSRLGGTEVVSTLLHEVSNRHTPALQRAAGLGTLARLAPARVMPLLEYLAMLGEELAVIDALQLAGDDAAIAVLRRLCEFPDVHERERASAALRALGVEPPPVAPVPPPEELVVHVGPRVRYRALRALDDRGDDATLLSFLAAAALDDALAKRFDGPSHRWKMYDRLSKHVRKLEFVKQVAWLRGKGGAELPAQVIWPSVERVFADGPQAVALTYPAPWPPMRPDAANALLDEERDVIAALRKELGLIDVPVGPDQRIADLFDGPVTPVAKPAPLPTPQVTPIPFPADVTPPEPGVLDQLLTAIGKEQAPSTDLLERANLPHEIARMSAGDAARKVAKLLGERSLEELTSRLIAKMPEIHPANVTRDMCQGLFPHAIKLPGMAERILGMWEQAYSLPWDFKSRATTSLFTVASHPAIFTRMIDEIVAPDDGPLRGRTSGALELVSEAVEQRALALSAVVARLRRDRGRPRERVQWRGDAMRALRRIASEDGVPTAILELADLASMDVASDVLELLAMFPSGVGALQQAVDLRKCARDAVRELCRSPLVGDASRHKFIDHPYWKLRLIAAEKNPNSDQSKREVAEVWAAIDVGGLPVSEDDRRYLRPDGLKQAKSATRLLPPPRDGMASTCFDYREWALWAVDRLMDPADAAARVFADELDIAMVERGHMRVAPRWMAWREKVPELPIDRRGRLAWARAQTDASLPPMLGRVRDEGARVVAAEFPAPCLVLPPELRKELEDRERQVAEAGEALFYGTP